LDRQSTLWSRYVWRGNQRRGFGEVLATGYEALDRHLAGGGWPRGALTEIYLDHYGIGELSLLMPALARLSDAEVERKWIVWIAPPFMPYAPALVRQGLRLDRLLLVHPSARRRDAFWAIEQALRSGGSAAVFAWVRYADQTVLRRLQLAAEERQCWTVLFRPLAALREGSPAALKLALSSEDAMTRIDILKCRGAQPGHLMLELADAQRQVNGGEAEW
jgi:hypothetical protein